MCSSLNCDAQIHSGTHLFITGISFFRCRILEFIAFPILI